MQTTEPQSPLAAATRQAKVFLLPPHATAGQRSEELQTAARLVRESIRLAVLGGCSDVGLELLAVAQRLEREAK